MTGWYRAMVIGLLLSYAADMTIVNMYGSSVGMCLSTSHPTLLPFRVNTRRSQLRSRHLCDILSQPPAAQGNIQLSCSIATMQPLPQSLATGLRLPSSLFLAMQDGHLGGQEARLWKQEEEPVPVEGRCRGEQCSLCILVQLVHSPTNAN